MPNTDPTHALQEAARRYISHVHPGETIRRIRLVSVTGETLGTVLVPPPRGEDAVPIVDPVKAKSGWDFAGPVPRFDGAIVPVHGRKADLLRVLAGANGPLTTEQLRPAWDGSIVEESAIRWQVMELRKALKLLFPGLEQPVLTTPEGYLLNIR